MNWDILSIVFFYLILLSVYSLYKKRFETQGLLVMYKTKWGLKLMDRLAKPFPQFLHYFSLLGVYLGFGGMAYLLYFLTKETIKLIFVAGTEPALAPVLPGVQIPGAPVLTFWHWLIAIFAAAVIHEFSHGVVARLHKIPIKSSGFAFFGPLLAAFVEPDEKVTEKKKASEQLAVFAAGPFSNMVLGAVILLFTLFVFSPLVGTLYQGDGVIVHALVDGYPMNATGIAVPFTILSVNGQETLTAAAVDSAIGGIHPGDTVTLGTNKGSYTVVSAVNPQDASRAFIGVSGFEQKVKARSAFWDSLKGVFDWLSLLLLWLFLINVGIGLFNLLPLGPVDGGRMFYTLALVTLKNESYAKRALYIVSAFSLALIVINMLPWLYKFLLWIGHGILLLF